METLALVIANGWASGISAYAVVLITGLVGRSGVADVPDVLTRTDVLVAAAVLTAVEVLADKVQLVDSLWDTVHTVVRPLIAAGLGALLAGDATTLGQAGAAAGAAGLALLTHSAKAGLRLAVNTSPEPVSNVGVSTVEDLSVLGVVLLAWQHPWVAAAVALVLLLLMATLAVVLFRRVRRGWRRVAARLQGAGGRG